MKKNSLASLNSIEQIIYAIRGQRVMLDRDLADLYGVVTKVLLQAVRRNKKRFPEDFMFQLTKNELENWRSQFVTSNLRAKMGLRRCPCVFTEHGIVMLANVLKSERAALISIKVVRIFVRLRQALALGQGMEKEILELKSFVLKHAHKTDQEFRKVWKAIEKLSAPLPPPPLAQQARIGFRLD